MRWNDSFLSSAQVDELPSLGILVQKLFPPARDETLPLNEASAYV
jgi:hypothetical protein